MTTQTGRFEQGEERSTKPFFTVVIPTMNRPQLLESALASVLWQTFQDFEVIVSDNSNYLSDREKNFQTISKYSGDLRLNYIRPPTWMNMPLHWEFATRKASGQYVLVLTDRFVMCPSSLEYIRTQIASSNDNIELISWDVSSNYNAYGTIESNDTTGGVQVLNSLNTVREFVKLDYWECSHVWSTKIPRILNCCYRYDVAEKIRNRHGRMFFPISPDYTGGYLILSNTNSFKHCDVALYISHGSESNGQRSLIYGSAQYLNSLGEACYSTNDPSSLKTVTNAILRDFLMVRDLVGDKFADIQINASNLLMANYLEIIKMAKLGSQLDLSNYYQVWSTEVCKLSIEARLQVINQVAELKTKPPVFARLRRWLVRYDLAKHIHAAHALLRHSRNRICGSTVYKDVLAGAAGEDRIIRRLLETHKNTRPAAK
jgi:hypothetical protein